MKKTFITIAIAFLFSITVQAQTDTTLFIVAGGQNQSYRKGLHREFPTLAYSYDLTTKTHDYSGNWDLDGDGIKDSMFFIGSGNKDLDFSLRMRLSSEQFQIRDFPWIASDLPYLASYEYLQNNGVGKKTSPCFVVHDFDGSGVDELYIDNRASTLPIPEEWRKQGVASDFILVKYIDKNIVIKNFKKKWIR